MTDKQIYDLLRSIDKGYRPTDSQLKALASETKITWTYYYKLPTSMNLLEGLTDLNLSNSSIEYFGALSGLKSLSKLNLSSTHINNLRALRDLSSLHFLYLGYTQITDIHPLACLYALSTLDLANTSVKDISPLTDLISLQTLYLSNTAIEDIRPLAGLCSLQKLYLAHTKISDLSPISKLKSLSIIDLRGVETDFIPESFLDLGLDFITDVSISGPGIYIFGIKIKKQDISIFRQPRELIHEYYKSLESEELIPVNKCKVVLLGDGGAGKRLIIHRLIKEDEETPNFDGKTTPGIDINSHTYTIGEDKIELSFWDFGGEAIMHSMHRLFLTNRTLYVIVANARENDASEQAWYWIQNIKSFADNAPVFLLVNHKDENPFVDINLNGLKREYPELKDFRIVSALKDSIDEFNTNIRDQILHIVQSMESVHTPFPTSWLSLMNNLQVMKNDRIFSDDFYTKCRESGIEMDDHIIDSIISWYQDLGICFYSRKHRVSRKYMVLKPKWLLNALYILIFNGRKYSDKGIISEEKIYELINEDVSTANIQKVYTDIKYTEQDVTFIIQVLMNFNLVRRLDNDSIFVPMLCDENEPEDIHLFLSEKALHYSFDYTYLPENVLYRLMIQQWHELNLKKAWKSGAAFEKKRFGWKSLVRILGNRLDIYTESENSREYPAVRYMDILCEAIRRINNELGLHAEEYITFREKKIEDRFKRSVLEGSKKAGLSRIYSDVFERILQIDVILGKTIKSSDIMTEEVITQMLTALSEISEQTVYMTDKGEVELTADFQRSIESALNAKYGIHVTRENTMGWSIKTIGETDLYFFKEENGNKEELYILENKVIRNFKSQYQQLIGYLNPNFRAGITLSINKEMGWEDAFDYICEKLGELKNEDEAFAPITIDRRTGTNGTKYVRSEHIVSGGYTMPVYHLVMQLSDKDRHNIAIKARS